LKNLELNDALLFWEHSEDYCRGYPSVDNLNPLLPIKLDDNDCVKFVNNRAKIIADRFLSNENNRWITLSKSSSNNINQEMVSEAEQIIKIIDVNCKNSEIVSFEIFRKIQKHALIIIKWEFDNRFKVHSFYKKIMLSAIHTIQKVIF
jgi:hypothetical protein